MLNFSVLLRHMCCNLPQTAGKGLSAAILGAVLLVGSAGHYAGNAMVVSSGEAFEINFTFPAAPVIPGGAIDTLVLTNSGASTSGPGIPVTAELFDGGTLLGAGNVPFSALTAFVAPLSLFAGIGANLDPVIDGSIDGKIRLTPNFAGGVGFIDFGPATLIVEAVRATGPGSAIRGQQFATIGSAAVVPATPSVSEVPLPAALPMLLSALAALGLALRRRRSALSTRRGTDAHIPPTA